MDSNNFSFYAIPAYWLLSLAPHGYAQYVIATSGSAKLDNVNPKGATYGENLRKRLTPDAYGRWERARACHNNCMENMPMFATAIIMGNMARLSVRSLNTAAGAFLAFRFAYLLLYINVNSKSLSFLRTAVWAGTVFACGFLMVKSANFYAFGSAGLY